MRPKRAAITDFGTPLKEDRVGGKFHKQAVMAKNGLPVPPFFCLATDAFAEFMAGLSGDVVRIVGGIDWASEASIRQASEDIHGLVVDREFSPRFSEAVFSAFDRHFENGHLVSVRSSMVARDPELSEDSALHAFAGMGASFLYVKRDHVPGRIKDCLASGFSPQALIYRHCRKISLTDFSVAVAVQKMVAADRSFVLFTCDPDSLQRNTLVVAGFGAGEGVVQEKVETDHYFVNGKTQRISRRVAAKERRLTFDQARGEGLAECGVPSPLRQAPVLGDDELLRLHDVGRTIERIFGCPQDIEGAFEDGRLFILQTRPVQFKDENAIVWTNANVSESFPGVTTPLTFSFAQDFYRTIFADCYRALGVPAKTLLRNMDRLDHMIGYIGGRIFYNLSNFYRLHSLSPLFPLFKRPWEASMGFSGSFRIDGTGRRGRGLVRRLASAAGTVHALRLVGWRFLTHQREVDRFLAWWEETIQGLRGEDFAGLSSFECLALFRSVWEQVGTHWWITLLNDTYLPAIYHWTESLLKTWGRTDAPGLMSDLLCGGESFKSAEILCSGIRLSELVKADERLRKLFEEGLPGQILETLGRETVFKEFKESFDGHLRAYGDRGLQELKLEQPRLRDEPERLVQIIKNYLARDLTAERFRSDEQSRRDRGEAELASWLKHFPPRRLLLRAQFRRLRGLIRNRENTRYCRAELFGLAAKIFHRIGEEFVETGIIDRKEDIFFLGVDEIFGLIEGANISADHKLIVKARKDELARYIEDDLPMDVTTHGPVYLDRPARAEAESGPTPLRGLGSCPGIVSGRARVVLDPHAVGRLEEGDILVAKETDPGWLFMMLASKGIVVERGSMLSHTAITGRAFGIPTIVSVPGITEKLKDGQMIEIDGGRGTIRIMDPA